MFKKFLDDEQETEMYITGAAGTGKTTDLKHTIQYCIENNLEYTICAYTHKAVQVLANKMPEKSNLQTLHSYLKKRPTINENARKIGHIDNSKQLAEPDKLQVIFIDEFSMVGNKDYEDLLALQYNDEGEPACKIVFLGDLNQLPPIKDIQTIVPRAPYHINLTTVYRQANDNKLLDTLTTLTTYIKNPKKAEPLKEHNTFKRNVNIKEQYRDIDDSIILCYTNKRVQELNRSIEGKDKLHVNDIVFSPTKRQQGSVVDIVTKPLEIQNIMDDTIDIEDKYRTLETLYSLDVQYILFSDENNKVTTRACVFGHSDYLEYGKTLKEAAVSANKAINDDNPSSWAKLNKDTKLARNRAKAWRRFLAYNSSVICVDYPHATTVHKAQGSTFEKVYLDIEDLGKCADFNFTLYLKLLYVGISRASKHVYTN